jgi:adenylate cyclase
MKLSFRVTLMTILVALTLLSVGVVGTSSYLNARFTANDLADQVIEQTSDLVDAQINRLLMSAAEQGKLNQRLVKAYQFDVHDFPRLARYWAEVMAVRRMTRMSLALEDSGEWFFVRRGKDRQLSVGDMRRDPATGGLRITEYQPNDYPHHPVGSSEARPDEDPRAQAWYQKAKKSGKQVWSDSYAFFGYEGAPVIPGISCVSPIYDEQQRFLGVFAASFDVIELCQFLRGLKVGYDGYAFVAEFRDDGQRRVIGHPEPEILIRNVKDRWGKATGVRELVAPQDLTDKTVPAFLDQLPAGFHPSQLKGIERFVFEHDGRRFLAAYHCLKSKETPDWLICVLVPEREVFGKIEQSNREAIGIGFGVLVLATVISLLVSRQVARPLERLARETELIGQLRVEAHPVNGSMVKEVDRLARAVEGTKTSLRSFQKYVPGDLVRLLLSSGQEATLGGECRRLSIYFCDLADFTSVAERLEPEELVRHLGDYFGCFSAEILASGGTVDKYIGDAIMAFWGAPNAMPQHALAACGTALKNQASLRELRERWRVEGKPQLRARIGIHTGNVVVGNIGSPARLNYTIMGDAVNLASRLEGLNKFYGTEILISEPTYLEAREGIVARPVDWVSVKGKSEGILTYELLGMRGQVAAELDELAELAARGLERYRSRDWSGAIGLFETVLRIRPDDGPASQLITRCRIFQAQPPVEEWDGVFRMTSK